MVSSLWECIRFVFSVIARSPALNKTDFRTQSCLMQDDVAIPLNFDINEIASLRSQ